MYVPVEVRDLVLRRGIRPRAGWVAPDGTYYTAFACHQEIAFAMLIRDFGIKSFRGDTAFAFAWKMGCIRVDTSLVQMHLDKEPTDAQIVTLYKLWQAIPSYDPMKESVKEFLNDCDQSALVRLLTKGESSEA